MSYGVVQAEKVTTESGYSLGAGNASSFKNRLINGAMTIDQRNAGAAITGISNGAYYAVDRFPFYNQSSGTWTAQQVTDAPAGFNNSLKLTVTSAGSTGTAAWTSFINAYIEGYNVADIGFGTANCKQTTLSFWVKSSIAGAFTYGLHNANDAWLTNTFTISSANTWEKITIQVPTVSVGTWLTTNGRGLGIFIGLGSGSNYTVSPSNTWYNTSQGSQYFASGAVALGATNGATFQVTGLQFEVGTVATSFDFRSIGTEYALCQRYYQTSTQNVAFGISSTSAIYVWKAPVTMRARPSTSIGGGGAYSSTTVYYESYPWNTAGTLTGAVAVATHCSVSGGDVLVTGTYTSAPATNQVLNLFNQYAPDTLPYNANQSYLILSSEL